MERRFPMKITTTERLVILITVAALAFFAGYYIRGASVRDAIQVETEKMPAVTVLQDTNPSDVPAAADIGWTPAATEEPVQRLNETEGLEPASSTDRSFPDEVPNDGRIDLNTADKETLETLPGIGPVLAERIIEYREKYGRFYSVEEIMSVSGIGEKTYADIADLVKVEVER